MVRTQNYLFFQGKLLLELLKPKHDNKKEKVILNPCALVDSKEKEGGGGGFKANYCSNW